MKKIIIVRFFIRVRRKLLKSKVDLNELYQMKLEQLLLFTLDTALNMFRGNIKKTFSSFSHSKFESNTILQTHL